MGRHIGLVASAASSGELDVQSTEGALSLSQQQVERLPPGGYSSLVPSTFFRIESLCFSIFSRPESSSSMRASTSRRAMMSPASPAVLPRVMCWVRPKTRPSRIRRGLRCRHPRPRREATRVARRRRVSGRQSDHRPLLSMSGAASLPLVRPTCDFPWLLGQPGARRRPGRGRNRARGYGGQRRKRGTAGQPSAGAGSDTAGGGAAGSAGGALAGGATAGGAGGSVSGTSGTGGSATGGQATGGASGSGGASGAAHVDPNSLPNVTLHLAGDSTVMTYAADSAQEGWGQELPQFLLNKVKLDNQAIGGASVETFYTGRWKNVMSNLKAGDYVMAAFGANDSGSVAGRHVDPPAFQARFEVMAQEVMAKQATFIAVTPSALQEWSGGKEGNQRLGAVRHRAAHVCRGARA